VELFGFVWSMQEAKVFRVHQDHKVLQDLKAIKVIKVHQVLKVHQVFRVLQDLKVIRVIKVIKVHQVLKVLQDLRVLKVIRVNKVIIPVFFAVEGKDESMGKPLVQSFRAVVGAPFESFNLFDLFRERLKGFHHFLHIFCGGSVFEFE